MRNELGMWFVDDTDKHHPTVYRVTRYGREVIAKCYTYAAAEKICMALYEADKAREIWRAKKEVKENEA